MSRDSSGTYTLPTGNPVTTNTTIDSAVHNTTMDDLGDELSDSLSRSGKGGMTAALRITDGSLSAPALAFTSDTNTGLYRIGTDEIGFVAGGTLVARMNASGFLSLTTGGGANLSPTNVPVGYLIFDGSGYDGYLTLDGTAMYTGHNSASRDYVVRLNNVNRLVVTPAAGIAGYYAGLLNWQGESQGLLIQSTTGSSTAVRLFSTAAALEGVVYTNNAGPLIIRAELANRGVKIEGTDSVGADSTLFNGEPDGAVTLYYDNTVGLIVANSGIQVFCTVDDNPAVELYQNDKVTRNGLIQASTSGMYFYQEVHGAPYVFISENNAGTQKTVLTGDPDAGVELYDAGVAELKTQAHAAAAVTSGAAVKDFGGTYRDVGYNVMPYAVNNSATTLSRTHISTLQDHASATVAWTTPASSDTDFPVGGSLNGVSSAAGLTIAAGAGVTLSWFTGAAVSTGTRTIAAGGVFTLVRTTSTAWYIWGSGIS